MKRPARPIQLLIVYADDRESGKILPAGITHDPILIRMAAMRAIEEADVIADSAPEGKRLIYKNKAKVIRRRMRKLLPDLPRVWPPDEEATNHVLSFFSRPPKRNKDLDSRAQYVEDCMENIKSRRKSLGNQQ